MQHTSSLPENGDVVGGKYRIERVIGMGGMGAVFEATHLITHRHFALKWLLNQSAGSAASVKRFVREAKVAGRCQHRHIVEVYDIHQESGALFMVMELLRGESLAERLFKAGRIDAPEAIRLLLPCLSAIEAAHAAGIVHRDIKPANLFVCAADDGELERAKVLDFGVACFSSPEGTPEFTQTHSGAVLGTPFYMAPEQMRGAQADRRVDVYALGVTLYEVLCGERPFFASTYAELVLQISGASPAPLEERVPELPPGLGAVVRRAMARDPRARFPTVHALASALTSYVDGSHSRVIARPFSLTDTPLAGESIQHAFGFPTPRRAWSRWLWLPLMAAAIAGLIALVWPRLRTVSSPAPSPLETETRAITSTPVAQPPASGTATLRPVSAPPVELPPSAAVETPLTPITTVKSKRASRTRANASPPPPSAAREHDDTRPAPPHPANSNRAAVNLDRSEF